MQIKKKGAFTVPTNEAADMCLIVNRCGWVMEFQYARKTGRTCEGNAQRAMAATYSRSGSMRPGMNVLTLCSRSES